MKKLSLYFGILLLSGLLILGCDKPAPTELVQDQNQLQVQVIAKDTQDEFYSNGFDTTGVVSDLSKLQNVITVTGAKITYQNFTAKASLAQTIFFDMKMPVHTQHGRIVGYRTVTPGTVKFNGITAKQIPLRVMFRDHGSFGDSLLGDRYVLYSGRNNNVNPFNYTAGSFVSYFFKPDSMGRAVSFNIRTPAEINANVKIKGSRKNNNLEATLEWDNSSADPVEIILGAWVRNSNLAFPLYRIKPKDNGRVKLPASLLNSIPQDKFDKFIFTFIRRNEGTQPFLNDRLHIKSQTIHTIIVDIP